MAVSSLIEGLCGSAWKDLGNRDKNRKSRETDLKGRTAYYMLEVNEFSLGEGTKRKHNG